MTFAKSGSFYQLRLARGEDISTAVVDFVRRHRIGSGVVTGLGAAEKVVLGYFDLGRKVYRKRRFPGEYEIAGITGNIAWDGKTPVCHLHAVIAGPRMNVYGGHLFEARVTVTCEIAIQSARKRLRRAKDPGTGLKLLKLAGS